ncbi:MAG TPA: primosomal protein N' [Candidatus Eisenbacteria bacterium]|nr:primosomal protein N' [Candidatus Eisenbacteria bacterium]
MFAHVAFPIPVRRTFVYSIPEEWAEACAPGVEVTAPFGARVKRGIVVEVSEAADHDPERVKPLASVLSPDPVIDASGLRLAGWVSEYYLCSLGEAIAAQLPGGLQGLAGSRSRKRAAAESAAPQPAALPKRHTLTTAQAHALGAVRAAVAEPRFETFLLHGVTGSGKTEVYLQAAAAARDAGRQTLLLVPEVALAHSVVSEARRRFGARVGVLHSYLGVGERRATWERARRGALDLVIGARSAVFAPLPALGLVVVDEEHEPAYKQSEQLRYHGRDVAVMRARLVGVPCLLGSATPSLESYDNARRGKYVMLSLPERVDRRPLPTVEVVDLGNAEAREPAGARGGEGGVALVAAPARVKAATGPALLSPRLATLVEAVLARQEQVLLFLNRRGHSRVVECEACGYAARCPHCDVSLTFHSARGLFLCHYCEHSEEARPSCPACGHPFFRYKVAGTQRVEKELGQLFPGTPIHRLDSDSARTRGHTETVLDGFRSGEPGILLGTQLVAKGHDFPGVTLVGVLNADTSLHVPDFRASERTFQLLTQVAGRAGRGERPGHVILQTRHPDHPALVAAARHDYENFAEAELAIRDAAGYPPATRLVSFLASSPHEDRVIDAAERLAQAARVAAEPAASEIEVLGPAPHVLMRLRGRYRWHVTLRSRQRRRLLESAVRLTEALAQEKMPAGVRVAVDVDPQDVL